MFLLCAIAMYTQIVSFVMIYVPLKPLCKHRHLLLQRQ